jgi:hypothetical protein
LRDTDGERITLVEKIEKAKIPDALAVRYLGDTFGLKSTDDRAMIPLLRKLGFLDSSGKPTAEYSRLKNKDLAKSAIAAGILRGVCALVRSYLNPQGKLALTTLPQLLRIIEEEDNWKCHFEPLVRDKALLSQTRLMVHTRNTVCHMSPVTPEEHERGQQVMRGWFRAVAP